MGDKKAWFTWKEELQNAPADEGCSLDDIRSMQSAEVYLSNKRDSRDSSAFIKPTDSGKDKDFLVPLSTGKMPRDLSKEEMDRYTSEVDEAKFKEIKGLYDLGCVQRAQRRVRHTCHPHIPGAQPQAGHFWRASASSVYLCDSFRSGH